MLSIQFEENAPFNATLLSDLRQLSAPQVVCVVKTRFVFCSNEKTWVLDKKAPDFQTIDCWTSIEERCVTDLVPEKKKSELLLWGEVRAHAAVTLIKARQFTEITQKTILKTGNVAPEPKLFWQADWHKRPAAKTKSTFLVAPAYARIAAPLDAQTTLKFENIFSALHIPIENIFSLNISFSGNLIFQDQKNHEKKRTLPFYCDTIHIDTDAGTLDVLWRSRFVWDLMDEQMGLLQIVAH